MNIASLERRLDKLAGPEPETKPAMVADFVPGGPIIGAQCGGREYTRDPGETEDDFTGRVIADNPATPECGTLVLLHRQH